MPPIPPQRVPVTCPNCGTQYQTDIYTIIDVTEQPELKQALLTGQLNVAVCPNCGTAAMPVAPLLYHDGHKELSVVLLPPELNIPPNDQEQIIGDLTSVVMRSLPEGLPRGHLFMPRRVMSLASLVDSVLEAEGIPREVLEGQRRRVELLSQLAQALPEEEAFRRLVEEHREEITPEFFATIEAFINASPQDGTDDSVRILMILRERLAELTGISVDAGMGDIDEPELVAVVEQLVNVDDEQLRELIGEYRQLIDYSFFQLLTSQIEELQANGDTAAADRLLERRTVIRETVEQMDQEAQALYEDGISLVREALQSDDPKGVLQANSARLNEAFMLVLTSNITTAHRAGQTEMAERLEQLQALTVEVLEEALSPEERFINRLLMLETPQERTTMLRSNAAQITPELVKQINEMADGQKEDGNQPMSDQLRQIAREAGAMLF